MNYCNIPKTVKFLFGSFCFSFFLSCVIGNITSSRSRGLLFEGKFSFQRSAVGSVIDGIFFKTDFRDSVVPKHANFEPKRIFFLDLCIQSNGVDYRQKLTAVVHLSFMYVFILIFVNPRVPPIVKA